MIRRGRAGGKPDVGIRESRVCGGAIEGLQPVTYLTEAFARSTFAAFWQLAQTPNIRWLW